MSASPDTSTKPENVNISQEHVKAVNTSHSNDDLKQQQPKLTQKEDI